MKKLLFIGFEFHKRTGSAEFLIRILESEYEVETCYVDLFKKDRWSVLSEVSSREFDVLVCWQVMPPKSELKRNFSFRHAVLFPMLDGAPSVKKPEKWYPFRNFQIISFSKKLDEQLKSIGLSSHAVQYFPEPIHCADSGKEDLLFFWNRREKINVNTVACLLKGSSVRKVHVHKALDPGNAFIDPEEEDWCSYSFSSWYETKEEMQADMQAAAFYMAPREKEGIGMSFLEAMAMGRCVIAPDYPTMNEYIEHGVTGYLYDLKNPERLSIGDVRKIQSNVIHFMKRGREKWELQKLRMLERMLAPVKISNAKLAYAMFLRFFKNPFKLVKSFYTDLKG